MVEEPFKLLFCNSQSFKKKTISLRKSNICYTCYTYKTYNKEFLIYNLACCYHKSGLKGRKRYDTVNIM